MKVKFTIKREADDPICPRISMGGNDEVGHYIVFRGQPDIVESIMEKALEQFQNYKKHFKLPYHENN